MLLLSLIACPAATDTAKSPDTASGDTDTGTVDTVDTTETAETGDTAETGETGETGDTATGWKPFAWGPCTLVEDVDVITEVDTKIAASPTVVGTHAWFTIQGDDGRSRIAVADEVASVDPPGFTWENARAVLDGSLVGAADAGGPAAIDLGGVTAVYFSGGGEGGKSDIFRCDTPDGDEYVNCAKVLDNADAGDDGAGGIHLPHVLESEGGFRMWFIAISGDADPIRRLYTATSTDGKTFTDATLALDVGALGEEDANSIYDPFVMRDAGGYRLMYSGLADGDPFSGKRLIEAFSTDGLDWSGFAVTVAPGCQGEYDAYAVDGPWVTMTDAGPRLYLDGRDTLDSETTRRRILTASLAP